jgi:glycine/D-amino acid oxidase-like deaminating enzyme/nitrite reductase/ring-hydroxylating ferredoxin subunit
MTSLWLDGYLPDSSRQPEVSEASRRDFDSVVVGAGITGLATAVQLARRGQDVAVVEARFAGAVTTGRSSAKVSVLQGTRLSQIARHHPDTLVTAYALSAVEGQAWLLDFCRTAGVAIESAPAVTYAGTADGQAAAMAEYAVAHRIGLDVEWRASAGLPFTTFGAVVMADQFQLDPMELVTALVAEFRALGGVLLEGVTATGVAASSGTLRTSIGNFRASALVLATGTPFLDRGLYFAKTEARRSYVQAFEFEDELDPDLGVRGMFLSADEPTRSLRTAIREGRRVLLVGGNGHVVGRHPSPALAQADLEHWTYRHFPGATRTHAWSAQDYHSDDEIPFIGRMPRGRGRIWFATGFDKWGLTNGPAAAQRIVAEILGDELPRWAAITSRRMTVPADLGEGIAAGLGVARSALAGWVGAESRMSEVPAEGQGAVSRGAVATSTVNGFTCSLSAVCPHLGGIVTWNDDERTWDCPLHGSRFAATGERLEGPAVSGLSAASTPV